MGGWSPKRPVPAGDGRKSPAEKQKREVDAHRMKCADEEPHDERPETKTPRADVSGGAQSFTVDILHNARVGAQGQSETRAIPESRVIT
jgi:hypothetical protein